MNAIGEFLRARRATLRPADVGLPEGTGLRRTPGLRREEVAALAGISIEYLVRLEQGKETNPSVAVLRALRSALLLDRESAIHLYALANRAADRMPCPRPTPQQVRPAVLTIMNALRPLPAYVLNRASDILAANPEALALLHGMADWPAHLRNTTRYTFLHPAARELYDDMAAARVNHVAHLRTELAADPAAQEVTALVEELSAASPRFAELWARYDVHRYRRTHKTFHHPDVGDVTVTSESLDLEDEGQRLMIYQAAPGTPDHDALTLLSTAATLRTSDTAPDTF